MKRIVSFIIVLTLMFTLAACAPASEPGAAVTPVPVAEPTAEVEPVADTPTEMPADEYERATWYGFLPDELIAADPDGTVVTWAQYCDMLGRMIKRYDESAYPAWEEMTANAPDTEMRRDGAMVSLLFAAKAMGCAVFNAQAPAAFGEYADKVWDKVTMNYPVFDWNTPVDLGEGCSDNNHVGPAYDFCLRRVSAVSGKALLEFDENNDLRLEQPLILREAALSVIRLYESDEGLLREITEQAMAELLSSPEVAEILHDAEALKQSILSSETEIVKGETYIPGETYTGTAYYISNGGSDDNDGLSPETPFATLAPFLDIEPRYGDAVFFERGSVWRMLKLPQNLQWTDGLTFSAYGEGEKPQFNASSENGGGAEKWSLHYEDESGKKIWVFHHELTEVAGVVLNNQTVARRDKAYWNGEQYYVVGEDYLPLEPRIGYELTEQLPNMWCFPALNYPRGESDEDFGRIYFSGWNSNTESYDCVLGKFFFRCDEGNPGELYESIEFIQPYPLVDGFADDQTYDNLCIRYSSMTFTSGERDGVPGGNGSVIQNCEVGWMGGNVTGYVSDVGSPKDRIAYNCGSMGCNGSAISLNGSNIAARNNYVHHSFQEGIAFETFSGSPAIEGNTVSGNLIERCTQAILLCNWDEEVVEEHIFKNIIVEDNIVLFSGDGNWFNKSWEEGLCNAMVLQGGPCAHDGSLHVRNNVFAFATGALVSVDVYSKNYCRVFSGNTYVQYPSDMGVVIFHPNEKWLDIYEGVSEYLADGSAVILPDVER